jgi:altronate dehydratase small subunit
MVQGLIIHPEDNVAVVTSTVPKGGIVDCTIDGKSFCTVIAREEIPIYHKIAIQFIPQNAAIKKYGYVTGVAVCDIAQGSHVHCHNIVSCSLKEEA